MPRRQLDVLLGAGAALFYLLNRLYGKSAIGGLFLSCYANDLAAGLALTAWLDLLFALAGRHAVVSWKQTVPYSAALSGKSWLRCGSQTPYAIRGTSLPTKPEDSFICCCFVSLHTDTLCGTYVIQIKKRPLCHL